MNSKLPTFGIALTACAALVTIGCGGGGGSPAATTTTTPTPVSGTPGAGDGGSSAPAASGDAGGGSAPAPSAPPPAPAHSAHRHCGWIGADTFAAGKATFLAHPDYYDAIHPVWASLNPDGSIRMLAMADDAAIMATAKAHHVKLMPLVAYDDASYLMNAVSTPAGVQAHAQAIADMVAKHGYDGVELDYEHLWSASNRAPYQATVAAITALVHAQGKQVSLALPAMDKEYAESGYDYVFLQKTVDTMHLMGYDFHFLGGDHLGPIAPKGWISDIVTRVQSLGAPEKYVLGIANYGIGAGWYTSAKDAASRCTTPRAMTTDHMASCPLGHQDGGLAPHCATAQGDVWFEDTASMGEKAQLAKAHGLGGVGVYAMGDEPDGFFDAMTAAYPAQ